MATTYDDIYAYFDRNIKVDSLDLPSTQEQQVGLVKDGVDEYNIRLERELVCDDITETINETLGRNHIKFIAECMKLIILKSMKEDFVSTWEVFQNDIGRRYYNNQLSGRENLVIAQEATLNRLAERLYEVYDGGDE